MQTKVIKEKLKSVGNIKKITKTMEMVSASKMKKAIDNALQIRPFHEEAQAILHDISLDPFMSHPLLKHNHIEKELLIIMTSNKGLCGGYNNNIYKKIIDAYDKDERKHVSVIAVGKFSEKIARRMHMHIEASFITPILSEDETRVLTKIIIEHYLSKQYGTVRLVYTHFTSATTFTPTLLTILPFSSEGYPKEGNGEPMYTYEPDQGEVLNILIPMMLQNIIAGVYLESLASEHSARMFAMKNATDNAKELQDELKLYFNRARQGAVTQAIAEITSGALALG